jgi:hypothetical protein
VDRSQAYKQGEQDGREGKQRAFIGQARDTWEFDYDEGFRYGRLMAFGPPRPSYFQRLRG